MAPKALCALPTCYSRLISWDSPLALYIPVSLACSMFLGLTTQLLASGALVGLFFFSPGKFCPVCLANTSTSYLRWSIPSSGRPLWGPPKTDYLLLFYVLLLSFRAFNCNYMLVVCLFVYNQIFSLESKLCEGRAHVGLTHWILNEPGTQEAFRKYLLPGWMYELNWSCLHLLFSPLWTGLLVGRLCVCLSSEWTAVWLLRAILLSCPAKWNSGEACVFLPLNIICLLLAFIASKQEV